PTATGPEQATGRACRDVENVTAGPRVYSPCTTPGVPVLVVVPFPASPSALKPQHSASSLASRAQLVEPKVPRPIEAPSEAKPPPSTSPGVSLCPPVEPLPSSPKELSPQQSTWADCRTAQTLASPPDIACTPIVRPLTCTGDLLSVVVPLPSSPKLFQPQHCTSPLSSRAHVYASPTAICTALVSPATLTGVLLLLVVPSPSCPLLFRPQHFTVWFT